LPQNWHAPPKMPPLKTTLETYFGRNLPLRNNINPSNMKYIFKNMKSLTGGILKKLPKVKISSHCLTASLTTVASLEPKRKVAQPPFYATTTNSDMPFGVLTSEGLLRLVGSFYLPFVGSFLLLHAAKPYRCVNFSD